MTDLVVVSLEAWDSVWRRNQHLVAGLLRRDAALRVLFVEPATDPLHAMQQGTRPRLGAGLREAPEIEDIRPDQLSLFEPTKWLPRRVDRSSDERWARQVVRAARGLGMGDPVLWVNDPRGAMIVEATTWRSLYDITDDWTLADRPSAETSRIEAQEGVLLSRCDEVVVCSPALVDSKGTGRGVTLIPNGVDSAAYSVHHPRPGDLPAARIVMYAGTLHGDRLDVQLVAATARGLSSHEQLVLVGPDLLTRDERHIVDTAGAIVLGARPSETVPAYLCHADVLVVPHLVTPFTDSLDPIKLYEYAAADRPVVSTPVAGFRDVEDDRVEVVDADRFVDVVLDRLSNPLHRAAAHRDGADVDWSDRVERMAAVISRLAR